MAASPPSGACRCAWPRARWCRDRSQRRGQTSMLRAISGLVSGSGGRVVLGGREISRWKESAPHRHPGTGARAGGAAALLADDRAREPQHGRLPAAVASRDPAHARGRRAPLSAPGRAAIAARRHLSGGEQADAGHRPRAHGRAATAPARRAIVRPGADGRARDRADHPVDQSRARACRCCWSSRTRAWRSASRHART